MEMAGNFQKKKTSLNQAGPLQRDKMKSLQVVSNLIKYCTNSLFYLDFPFMGNWQELSLKTKKLFQREGLIPKGKLKWKEIKYTEKAHGPKKEI